MLRSKSSSSYKSEGLSIVDLVWVSFERIRVNCEKKKKTDRCQKNKCSTKYTISLFLRSMDEEFFVESI